MGYCSVVFLMFTVFVWFWYQNNVDLITWIWHRPPSSSVFSGRLYRISVIFLNIWAEMFWIISSLTHFACTPPQFTLTEWFCYVLILVEKSCSSMFLKTILAEWIEVYTAELETRILGWVFQEIKLSLSQSPIMGWP